MTKPPKVNYYRPLRVRVRSKRKMDRVIRRQWKRGWEVKHVGRAGWNRTWSLLPYYEITFKKRSKDT